MLGKIFGKRNAHKNKYRITDEIDISAEFEGRTAEEIAVHRKNIAALPNDAEWDEIIETLVNSQFSRIPVYEGNIDNVVGILHSKDLLNALLANADVVECIKRNGLNLNEMLRKPYFVPFNKKLESIYTKMKNGRVHMAIVVDEYGGTAGLLTNEDLIEEIMGDIYDEYDTDEDAEPNIDLLKDNVYIIKGTTPLEEIAEHFNLELPDEYDTVSGFIVGQLGRIPEQGEQPSFEYEGLVFKVYETREMRVLYAFVCVVEME
jgi:putative hemolysin